MGVWLKTEGLWLWACNSGLMVSGLQMLQAGVTPYQDTLRLGRGHRLLAVGLQGYLAHEKAPPPRSLQ